MGLFLKSVKGKLNREKIHKGIRNSGFSLVEVLVAMAILAIVSIPILSYFASAAKVNSNARRQENANAIAQKVIEECKSLSITQLTDGNVKASKTGINNSATGVLDCLVSKATDTSDPDNQLIYQLAMGSFDSVGTPKKYSDAAVTDQTYYEGANGEHFFVDVTLDPTAYADKSAASTLTDVTSNNINSFDMPTFNNVNANGNFVLMDQVSHYDVGIISEFKDKYGITGISAVGITKQVTVDVKVAEDSAAVKPKLFYDSTGAKKDIDIFTQTLKFKISYTCMGKTIDHEYTYTLDNIVDNAAEINKLNAGSSYNTFKNTYLFYTPYDTQQPLAGLASPYFARDSIDINYQYPTAGAGTSGVTKDKLNVYLVEQAVNNVNSIKAAKAYTGSLIPVKINTGNVNVNVNGTDIAFATNGTVNLGDGTDGMVNIYSNVSGWNAFKKSGSKSNNSITQNATPSDTKYLYNITVKIYTTPPGTTSREPFMTVTSTKEN